jgi:serine/threonine protein kinase
MPNNWSGRKIHDDEGNEYEVGESLEESGQGAVYSAVRNSGKRGSCSAVIKFPKLEELSRVLLSRADQDPSAVRAEWRVAHGRLLSLFSRECSNTRALIEAAGKRGGANPFPEWCAKGRVEPPEVGSFRDCAKQYELTPCDVPFIATAKVVGQTLEQRFARRGPSVEAFLAIARQVAAGLAWIHEAGFIHGDVHPGNILIDSTGGPIAVYFIDFGLSEDMRKTVLGSEAAGGAEGFIAPEIIVTKRNATTNPRTSDTDPEPSAKHDELTDVWSYGALLYYLLKGHRLIWDDLNKFARGPLAVGCAKAGPRDAFKFAVRKFLMNARTPVVQSHPHIVDLITRALREDRDHRTQTAEYLVRDCELCDPDKPTPEELHNRRNAAVAQLQAACNRLPDPKESPNDVFADLAALSAEELASAMHSIEEGHIVLTASHERLVHRLCRFMQTLGQGDRYTTVSFPEFWGPGNLGLWGRFYTSNFQAVVRGVKLRRLFLVRNEDFERGGSHARLVLRLHQSMLADLGLGPTRLETPKGGQYDLHVATIDSADYQRALDRGDNFALWERGTDSFVSIRPRYVSRGNDHVLMSIRIDRVLKEVAEKMRSRYEHYLKSAASVTEVR